MPLRKTASPHPPPPSSLPPNFALTRDSRVLTDFPTYEDMSKYSASHPHPSLTSPTSPTRTGFLQGFTSAAAGGARSTAGNASPKSVADFFSALRPIRLIGTSSAPKQPGSPTPSADSNHSANKHARHFGILSTVQLMTLTISLAGAQAAWTVEFGSGTPYLLSLGLTPAATSLVWIAGPLSGLVVQPLIGAISDASEGRFRRRKFIVSSGFLVALAGLGLAYCESIGALVVRLWPGSSSDGDWDPRNSPSSMRAAVVIAVFCFYLLDFALNALQAACRALILDRVPASQQSEANAWHGRMTHVGNVVGYGIGWANLGLWEGLSWLGGGQFRKLCIIVIVLLAISLATTCSTQPERPGHLNMPGVEGGEHDSHTELLDGEEEEDDEASLTKVAKKIWRVARILPIEIQRVCHVQLLAWCGWFPFLFYASTYVGESVTLDALRAGLPPPSSTEAARSGNSALLVFSIVAGVSGAVLPWMAALGTSGFVRRRGRGAFWRYLRLALARCTARNIWSASILLFSILSFCTFLVDSATGAKTIVALVGIPWAVTCWVPFALIMEYIRVGTDAHESGIQQVRSPGVSPNRDNYGTNAPPAAVSSSRKSPKDKVAGVGTGVAGGSSQSSSGQSVVVGERSHLLPPGVCATDEDWIEEEDEVLGPESGGTILGIHNLSIVMPEFFVSIVSSIIFRIVDGVSPPRETSPPPSFSSSSFSPPPNKLPLSGRNDVVWVLRFGGLLTLGAFVISRWIVPPGSELEYQDELGWQIYKAEVRDQLGPEERDE